MLRLYQIPILKFDLGNILQSVPKYIIGRRFYSLSPPLAGLEDLVWAWVTYLHEDTAIILADITQAQHDLLVAQPGVMAIPDLDSIINTVPERNKVRAALEAVQIPADWVGLGMNYRAIMRIILGIFKFHGRFAALIQGRVFDGSLNLDMTVADIPQQKRQRLQNVADEFGLDYSWVTGATTIRQLLHGMGQQFASTEFVIDGAGIRMVI